MGSACCISSKEKSRKREIIVSAREYYVRQIPVTFHSEVREKCVQALARCQWKKTENKPSLKLITCRPFISMPEAYAVT